MRYCGEVCFALLGGRADEARNRERSRRGCDANFSAELHKNPIALLVTVSIPARDGAVPAGLQASAGEVQTQQYRRCLSPSRRLRRKEDGPPAPVSSLRRADRSGVRTDQPGLAVPAWVACLSGTAPTEVQPRSEALDRDARATLGQTASAGIASCAKVRLSTRPAPSRLMQFPALCSTHRPPLGPRLRSHPRVNRDTTLRPRARTPSRQSTGAAVEGVDRCRSNRAAR